MATEPIAVTIRKETESLIGKLVMQNTTLTAQMNALAEEHAALKKELDAANAALAETKKALEEAQAAPPARRK